MKNLKYFLIPVFLVTCLCSGPAIATGMNQSGLIGLSDTDSLREYSFSLPEDTSITFDLVVLDQSTGGVEATLLVAQGVAQHLKVNLSGSKTIFLAAGEYQLMVYAKLLDAEYAHIEVKVSDAKVLISDVITLLDKKIGSANTYRKIQHDFSLPTQQSITLTLTDYEQITDFPDALKSPLVNTFFTLNNTQTSELSYFGGIEGLENADLSVGSYQLQIHFIADLDAHRDNEALISGLAWSLRSRSVVLENLELITSESIFSGENKSVYDFGFVDFGEGGHYDFKMRSSLGANIDKKKILFVHGALEGESFALDADAPAISEKFLSGIYQVFAFIPEGKSGALEIAIQQSINEQIYWAQVLPLGEARFLKHITVAEDSDIIVQIKDLGFANAMQSAELMLSNGLDSYSFSLAEGPKIISRPLRAGSYSLLAITETKGNALLYVDIKTDKGESLYQDYVFEGRGGFYAETVILSDGEYTFTTKDHDLPAMGHSYSALVLQKDQLFYKHQSFGNVEMVESELVNLTSGEYVLAFAIDPSEAGDMVLGYGFSERVSELPLEREVTDRSLGEPGKGKSSSGSLGYYFLIILLVASWTRIMAVRNRVFL